MSEDINPKFGVPLSTDVPASAPFASRAFTYSDVYEVQRTANYERLALAPAGDHIGLLRELSDMFNGPFGILYVLSLSRRGEAKPGRYQSPEPIEGVLLHSFLEDHRAFLEDHRAFLEGDARHAIWVFALDANATLVYDRHNILYAYGPLERSRKAAEARGLKPGKVQIPVPHTHAYNAAFDAEETRMLAQWNWKWFPLQPPDED